MLSRRDPRSGRIPCDLATSERSEDVVKEDPRSGRIPYDLATSERSEDVVLIEYKITRKCSNVFETERERFVEKTLLHLFLASEEKYLK